jgi:4-amino-4-deoxy-L-arabinose transferase-like glycosyltransferase
MAYTPRFSLLDGILLLIVLAAAAVARGWYLWHECGDFGNQAGPVQVQDEPEPGRKELIDNLSQSGSFRSRRPFGGEEGATAHTAPGYPILVAALSRAPLVLSSAEQEVRWLQWLLGTVTAGFYFAFARRVFQHLLVALLTGLFVAFYPFWVINTAEIDDGVLTTFLLAAVLILGAGAGESGGAGRSLLYGLLLAGLALVRAALLPFAFVGVLWFLVRCRRLRGGWLFGLITCLGFLIGLVPWALRNYQELHEVLPIVDSTYLHLWMGNNALATGGPESEETMRQALAQMRGEEANKEAAPTPEELARATLGEVRERPAETLRRRLQAGLAFVFGADWFTEQRLWRGSVVPGAAALLYGTFLAMLLLAFVGWRCTYPWRFEARPAALAILVIPLPYLIGHAAALQGPRLPLDGVLLCYAAFILVYVLPAGRSLRAYAKLQAPTQSV